MYLDAIARRVCLIFVFFSSLAHSEDFLNTKYADDIQKIKDPVARIELERALGMTRDKMTSSDLPFTALLKAGMSPTRFFQFLEEVYYFHPDTLGSIEKDLKKNQIPKAEEFLSRLRHLEELEARAKSIPGYKPVVLRNIGESSQYSELSRIFLLVDPLFVTDDIHFRNANHPELRFNVHDYTHTPTPAWQDFTKGFEDIVLGSSAQNPAEDLFYTVHKALLTGNVDGTLQNDLDSGRTKDFDRSTIRRYWMSQDRFNILSDSVKKGLHDYFNVTQDPSTRVKIEFKTAQELASTFSGIDLKTSPSTSQVLMNYIRSEVEKVSDPIKRATKILYLLPRIHPYSNAMGRESRAWAAVELLKAGLPMPVGLTTNDFLSTEGELELEVRKSLELGRMWQWMLHRAMREGVSPDEFFQKEFKGSALEALIHITPVGEEMLKKHIEYLKSLPSDLRALPPTTKKWARGFLDNVLSELQQKGVAGRLEGLDGDFGPEEKRHELLSTKTNEYLRQNPYKKSFLLFHWGTRGWNEPILRLSGFPTGGEGNFSYSTDLYRGEAEGIASEPMLDMIRFFAKGSDGSLKNSYYGVGHYLSIHPFKEASTFGTNSAGVLEPDLTVTELTVPFDYDLNTKSENLLVHSKEAIKGKTPWTDVQPATKVTDDWFLLSRSDSTGTVRMTLRPPKEEDVDYLFYNFIDTSQAKNGSYITGLAFLSQLAEHILSNAFAASTPSSQYLFKRLLFDPKFGGKYLKENLQKWKWVPEMKLIEHLLLIEHAYQKELPFDSRSELVHKALMKAALDSPDTLSLPQIIHLGLSLPSEGTKRLKEYLSGVLIDRRLEIYDSLIPVLREIPLSQIKALGSMYPILKENLVQSESENISFLKKRAELLLEFKRVLDPNTYQSELLVLGKNYEEAVLGKKSLTLRGELLSHYGQKIFPELVAIKKDVVSIDELKDRISFAEIAKIEAMRQQKDSTPATRFYALRKIRMEIITPRINEYELGLVLEVLSDPHSPVKAINTALDAYASLHVIFEKEKPDLKDITTMKEEAIGRLTERIKEFRKSHQDLEAVILARDLYDSSFTKSAAIQPILKDAVIAYAGNEHYPEKNRLAMIRANMSAVYPPSSDRNADWANLEEQIVNSFIKKRIESPKTIDLLNEINEIVKFQTTTYYPELRRFFLDTARAVASNNKESVANRLESVSSYQTYWVDHMNDIKQSPQELAASVLSDIEREILNEADPYLRLVLLSIVLKKQRENILFHSKQFTPIMLDTLEYVYLRSPSVNTPSALIASATRLNALAEVVHGNRTDRATVQLLTRLLLSPYRNEVHSPIWSMFSEAGIKLFSLSEDPKMRLFFLSASNWGENHLEMNVVTYLLADPDPTVREKALEHILDAFESNAAKATALLSDHHLKSIGRIIKESLGNQTYSMKKRKALLKRVETQLISQPWNKSLPFRSEELTKILTDNPSQSETQPGKVIIKSSGDRGQNCRITTKIKKRKRKTKLSALPD